MGYTTDFSGKFKLNKTLDNGTLVFLTKLSQTRRMKRNVLGYGVQGEFYVDGKGDFGQANDSTIVDYNRPPSTQPSLWCQWTPTEDGKFIEWDGGEKFYEYVEWLKYIIENILEPRNYALTGTVEFQGEDPSDFGKIIVKNNKIKVARGERVYGRAK